MSIYSYPQSPVIDEVTFRKTANDAERAYLHVRDGVDADKIQAIKKDLKEMDLEWLPYGKETLEIRGFKNEDKFRELLGQKKWVEGKANVKLEAGDRIGWKQWLRKRTMQLSGIFMAVADVGFGIYGLKEAKQHKKLNPNHKRDFSEALAGLAYLSGSTVLTIYGRNDQSAIQIREMADLILKEAQRQGFTIPEDSAAATLGVKKKESVLRKVDNFFSEYPSEIGNMMYFTAGTLIAQSALRNRVFAKPRAGMSEKQIKERFWGGVGDTALGASTMASGALATFGREKELDPDDPQPRSMVGRAISWIKRHPLAMASYGYIGSTACHAFTTYKDRKEAIRASNDHSLSATERDIAKEKLEAIPFRRLYIGATLIGELLLSISSKGHGEGVVSDTSVDDSTIAIAADLIVRQPQHMQDHLIEYMEKFLGGKDMLALGNVETTDKLRQEVEAMRKNPWALASGKKETAPPSPPAIIAPYQAEPATLWQAKTEARRAAEPPLQPSF